MLSLLLQTLRNHSVKEGICPHRWDPAYFGWGLRTEPPSVVLGSASFLGSVIMNVTMSSNVVWTNSTSAVKIGVFMFSSRKSIMLKSPSIISPSFVARATKSYFLPFARKGMLEIFFLYINVNGKVIVSSAQSLP
ncbi:hypothetical protein CDAR_100391 [Caerostris darwini]|uniref:Uncharacterized protein n=1 Tax=Caerostris darwini TaxID=1538125 RepID=A0AAV4X3J4_9ARAC|nr:hypothetical protein CDAR_100391 [Caerostris darwini]